MSSVGIVLFAVIALSSGAVVGVDAAKNSMADQKHLDRLRRAAEQKEKIEQEAPPPAEGQPQNLRVCNAYAWSKPLDIHHNTASLKALTGDKPLAYKECRDFEVPLQEGDEIEFKAGNLEVGTFYATGIPKTKASLLLIPRKKEADSMAVHFESHAFSDLMTAQVAVVDAYQGAQTSNLKIGDDPKHKAKDQTAPGSTAEDLRYNSVVALNPGQYQLSLVNSGGATVKESPIDVHNEVKYVIMRVGGGGSPSSLVESSAKTSTPKELRAGGEDFFPEELVVFPQLSGSVFVRLSSFVGCIAILAAHLAGKQ